MCLVCLILLNGFPVFANSYVKIGENFISASRGYFSLKYCYIKKNIEHFFIEGWVNVLMLFFSRYEDHKRICFFFFFFKHFRNIAVYCQRLFLLTSDLERISYIAFMVFMVIFVHRFLLYSTVIDWLIAMYTRIRCQNSFICAQIKKVIMP